MAESFVFLGYQFYRQYRKIDPKKKERFKQKVRDITRRNQTVDLFTLIKEELNPVIRGWGNYFKYTNEIVSSKSVMDGFEEGFEWFNYEAGERSRNSIGC
ncbi:group II intron maturase-specific domain-containing protein [Bacillus fonticola]|uniref:group II intron maturase-specific domain-containing protein n=1 Tax=Bacillus fonticola TaxID=2728853 RepID=UPI0014742337|nr:group II intron maturase-specific domain-containing protein [Bacillus fonticola]